MKIEIIRDGAAVYSAEGQNDVYLVIKDEYKEGDCISFTPDEAGYLTLQFDAVLGRSTLYTNGKPFTLPVPFNQKHDCYHDAVYRGSKHFLWARKAYKWECGYRNLALNPYDAHENESLFPHAKANIETRGESVFAARNAIDGIVASNGHGEWPWSSWGINRDPEAELTLDFGRNVEIDRIIVYFSDGSELVVKLEKKDGPQEFTFEKKTVSSLSLFRLIKSSDPSPFPALIQLEVYGNDC